MQTERLAKRMLLICSMVTISGCTYLSGPEFPADYYYELDINNHMCGKWKITNKRSMVATFDEDLPIFDCNGVIGFKPDEAVKVFRWIRRVKQDE